MKLFKKRNIQALIYGLFMLLPFLSILGRVLYTQWNQEAYRSYSGTNPVYETQYPYETNEVNTIDDIVLGNIYLIEYSAEKDSTQASNIYFQDGTPSVNNVDILKFECTTPYLMQNSNYDVGYVDFFAIYTQYTSYGIMTSGRLAHYDYSIGDAQFNLYAYENIDSYDVKLYVVFHNTPRNVNYVKISDWLGVPEIVETEGSYLDNAFEYSVHTFVQENNFGNFDFFQWFSTFFLQDNAVNNLYVHFINWYMNYMLYVSLGYLIFSILMWFVNFFRSLVEKSTDLNL